jgi:hypothetical protein
MFGKRTVLFVVLCLSILSMTSSAIGISGINKCPEKADKGGNKGFLVMNLIIAVILTLVTGFGIYYLTMIKPDTLASFAKRRV